MAKSRSILDTLATVVVGVAAVIAGVRSRPNPSDPVASAPDVADRASRNQEASWIKGVLDGFKRHRVPRMAAALAYYTIFSLAPLLILLFTVAGLIFDDDAARDTLFEQLESAAGAGIADTVADLVAARSGGGGSGTFATILGFVFLFVGASGLFLQLRTSLNTVWEVPQEETSGAMNILRARLSGFAAVLVLAAALLLFTVGSGLVAFFAEEIADALPALSGAIQVLNPIVAILGVSAVIGILFRLLPATDISWRIAFRGGVATTVLMAVGAGLVGVLFAFSNPGESFGQFAAIIVLLVFIYYLAQAFLLGAEVTASMDRRQRTRT